MMASVRPGPAMRRHSVVSPWYFLDSAGFSAINDGNGVSHESWVRYSVFNNNGVYRTIVYRVKYGGRHPESFCVTAGQWQRYRIKYWGYDGNNWFVPHEVGRGSWRSIGTPGLDFHTYFRNVDLDIGGWVYAKLRYKARNWCINTNVQYPGRDNEHYLELN